MLPLIVLGDLPLHIRFRFATGEKESANTPQFLADYYHDSEIHPLATAQFELSTPEIQNDAQGLSATLVIRLCRDITTSFHGTSATAWRLTVYHTLLPLEYKPIGT